MLALQCGFDELVCVGYWIWQGLGSTKQAMGLSSTWGRILEEVPAARSQGLCSTTQGMGSTNLAVVAEWAGTLHVAWLKYPAQEHQGLSLTSPERRTLEVQRAAPRLRNGDLKMLTVELRHGYGMQHHHDLSHGGSMLSCLLGVMRLT